MPFCRLPVSPQSYQHPGHLGGGYEPLCTLRPAPDESHLDRVDDRSTDQAAVDRRL